MAEVFEKGSSKSVMGFIAALPCTVGGFGSPDASNPIPLTQRREPTSSGGTREDDARNVCMTFYCCLKFLGVEKLHCVGTVGEDSGKAELRRKR